MGSGQCVDVTRCSDSCCLPRRRRSWTPSSPAIGTAALAFIAQRADVNAPEADGTTALHWAVHHGDLDLAQRLIRAGAKVNAKNEYGSTPMSEAAILGRRCPARDAAQGRRRRRVAERRRSDRADGRGAHQPGGCRASAAAPRREGERGRAVARPDRADVGRGAEPAGDGRRARRGRRRRQRAIDGEQLAAPGHRRAARDLPPGRRTDAPALCRPRGMRRVRAHSGRGRRRPQSRRSRRASARC